MEKVRVEWLGIIRYREPTDEGVKDMNGQILFYDWKLSFVRQTDECWDKEGKFPERELHKAIIKRVKELKDSGNIIDDRNDAIKTEAITHIVTKYSLDEMEKTALLDETAIDVVV